MTKAKRRVDYVTSRGRKQVSAELPMDLVEELDQIAKDSDVARQTVVLWALRDYVKKYPKLAQLRDMVS